jgi:hypothetical protein
MVYRMGGFKSRVPLEKPSGEIRRVFFCAALTEIALVAQLDRLERKNGGAFPVRTASLRVGRPVR